MKPNVQNQSRRGALPSRAINAPCDCGRRAVKRQGGYPICARCAALGEQWAQTELRRAVAGIIARPRPKGWDDPPARALRPRIEVRGNEIIIHAHGTYRLGAG